MSAVLALSRVGWQTMISYRFQTLLSIASLGLTVVPLYFIADAVQPVMAESIQAEGGSAFSFLLVGMATVSLIAAVVSAVPQGIASSVRTGTLEALLATPTAPLKIVAGLSGFPVAWATLRTVLLVAAGWVLGAELVVGGLAPAALILTLIVLSHIPFGLLGAAMVLVFRTAQPLPQVVIAVSSLLGGVYYPTEVVPSWLALVSDVLPLSYGLRALRRVALQGDSLGEVGGEVMMMTGGSLVLFAISLVAFSWALRHARRTGTLAQY